MIKLLRQSPLSARIGLGIVMLNILVAICAPIIAPYGETSVVGDVWEVFSAQFYFGTDHIGRDLFTRMVFGARNTIALAFITTILSFSLGSLLGFISAVKGGWTDQVLSRAIDIIMAFPTLIFALMILSVLGSSILVLIFTIAILDSTRVYRLSRAVAMDIEVM
ncbi:MAG: ABC transporter permease, partial [Desulfobacteraceae bacterium]|nr:ABC transporter permease [Desulfobacteraceae bacterium]